jgi:hypothetical protein
MTLETDFMCLVMMAKAGHSIHRGIEYVERRRVIFLQRNSSYNAEPELCRKVSSEVATLL